MTKGVDSLRELDCAKVLNKGNTWQFTVERHVKCVSKSLLLFKDKLQRRTYQKVFGYEVTT